MKIVYIFTKFERGGAEFNAIYLAKEAEKAGNEVIFVLGEEGSAAEELKREEIRYRIIKMESSFNPILVLRSIFALKSFLNKEKIDLVHAHMLREHSLVIGAKFLGANIKVVRTIHRLDQYNWKMKPLLWFYNYQTDAFIAVSEYLKTKLNWVKTDKISVIENGIPEIKVSQRGELLGTFGRLYPEKGVYEFLKESGYESEFIVGGSGPDLKKIKELNNKKVEIYGPVLDRTDFFSRIALFVLPSRSEVLPLTVLESFSAGVPVLAFDIPALRELINDNNGILVPAFNNKKMAEVAQNLLKDKNRLKKLSMGARETYLKKFTIDKMWENSELLYKNLLN